MISDAIACVQTSAGYDARQHAGLPINLVIISPKSLLFFLLDIGIYFKGGSWFYLQVTDSMVSWGEGKGASVTGWG